MLGIILACAFVFVWLCSYFANTDLFSPIKLYLLTLFICFLDIFLSPYSLGIDCVYLGLLLVPLGLSVYESRAARPFSSLMRYHKLTPVGRSLSSRRAVAIIWLLTIVPIGSM